MFDVHRPNLRAYFTAAILAIPVHATTDPVGVYAVVDRVVLRMGVYEMLADPETPSKVIINEAIELARSYSGDEAVGFVNGVLDAVRKQLRRT